MSYHIYTTEGIILKRMTFGEANVILYVLTKDLGLILASARSARLSVSKLRPALQEYELVSLSCIKSKNGWKITNVAPKSNYYYDLPKHAHVVLAQVSFVLLKMIQGESPNTEIFQTVYSGLEFLKSVKSEDVPKFEILVVLRVLHLLGYVVVDLLTKPFLTNSEKWDKELLEQIFKEKENLVKVINKALKESHL